ncbi:MAG: GNAT family N-acetyltransferase [Novosphingobium sp.]|nr:GNAT family N-acetyltransferase [Novosphingobium sp.]
MNDAASLTIVRANYGDSRDAADVVAVLDSYARDPMGGAEPLSEEVRSRLIDGLAAAPGAFSLIARLDDKAVGIANCFTGFSTFAARPLVNIHDIAVLPGLRGKGIGRALLSAVDDAAREIGACKVTLEVLSGNERAKGLYASHGFGDFVLDPEAGTALLWQKKLDD